MSERLRRVWHPAGGAEGERIVLSSEESHHACRVLRLAEGSTLSVFDGAGSEWEAVLEQADAPRATVRLGAARADRVDPGLEVTLVQALVRPERIEWVLQKGTEVGVASFALVRTRRSEVRDPTPARLDRWRKILVEACKQSGRRRIPPLLGPLPEPPPLEPGALALLLDPDPVHPPLANLLSGPAPGRVAVAVGPEGGLDAEETSRWRAAGWACGRLGPRVLRTETAGPIAVSLVLFAWGDLGRDPSGPWTGSGDPRPFGGG